MTEPDLPPLMGVLEIARYAGVDKSAVVKWKIRHHDFPQPVARLAMGDVYSTELIVAYLLRHNYPRRTT